MTSNTAPQETFTEPSVGMMQIAHLTEYLQKLGYNVEKTTFDDAVNLNLDMQSFLAERMHKPRNKVENPFAAKPVLYTAEQAKDLVRDYANMLSQREGQYLPCMSPLKQYFIDKGL